MKAALIFCLSMAVMAVALADDKPTCLMGTFEDCSSMQYTSDYQTGMYYCCADEDLTPVLGGDMGDADRPCSCYSDVEYCNLRPWEC